MNSTILKVWIWFLIWFYKNLNGFRKVSVKLLYSQAWHETGNFKSQVFNENKNIFGMRHPSVRETVSLGSKHSHAYYKNVKDSVRDYFKRQRNFKIPNVGDLAYVDATVSSRYAEDKLYKQKWLAIYEKMKPPTGNGLLYMVGVFFLLVIAILLIRAVYRYFKAVKHARKDERQRNQPRKVVIVKNK